MGLGISLQRGRLRLSAMRHGRRPSRKTSARIWRGSLRRKRRVVIALRIPIGMLMFGSR
jgi:hypothetical protein